MISNYKLKLKLIYNVFNMSFDERSKYLGMLSSIGATGKQKRSSVYYEAFSLLLPALPTGILIGLGVVKAGVQVLAMDCHVTEDSMIIQNPVKVKL